MRHETLRVGGFFLNAACRTLLVSPAHEPGTVNGMAEDDEPDRLAAVRWNIRRIRGEKGMSQADLAHEVSRRGVKFFPQTVQKIENGKRTIGLDEGLAIAGALRVSLEDLLTDKSQFAREVETMDAKLAELDGLRESSLRARHEYVARWRLLVDDLRELAEFSQRERERLGHRERARFLIVWGRAERLDPDAVVQERAARTPPPVEAEV